MYLGNFECILFSETLSGIHACMTIHATRLLLLYGNVKRRGINGDYPNERRLLSQHRRHNYKKKRMTKRGNNVMIANLISA